MPYVRGYEEDGFLKKLGITRQTLEILSKNKVGIKASLQEHHYFQISIAPISVF